MYVKHTLTIHEYERLGWVDATFTTVYFPKFWLMFSEIQIFNKKENNLVDNNNKDS